MKFILGIHMWSLFVPIHVKRWPKAKSGHVEVGLLRIACLVNRKSYMWSLCAPIQLIHVKSCSKVKMKQAGVGLNIAKYHLFSPQEVICGHYNSSKPKVKIGQLEVRSNISENHLFSQYEVMCGHYLCQFMWKLDQKLNWVKLKSNIAQNHFHS